MPAHRGSQSRRRRGESGRNITRPTLSQFGSLLDRRAVQLRRIIHKAHSETIPSAASHLAALVHISNSDSELPRPPQLPSPSTLPFPLISVVPLARRPLIDDHSPLPLRHMLQPFSTFCSFCRAQCFSEERTARSSRLHPTFSICCQAGSVLLPSFPAPPEPLKSLLIGDSRGTSAGSNSNTDV